MSSFKFPEKQLSELQSFVSLIASRPSILNQSELAFFKIFLESWGAKIPASEETSSKPSAPPPSSSSCPFGSKSGGPADMEVDDLVESDIDLDDTGVIGNEIIIFKKFKERTPR